MTIQRTDRCSEEYKNDLILFSRYCIEAIKVCTKVRIIRKKVTSVTCACSLQNTSSVEIAVLYGAVHGEGQRDTPHHRQRGRILTGG